MGSGGNIVSDQFARVMKTTGLSSGTGGKVRVTTEFPHLIFPNGGPPAPAPGPTEVYLFGYTSNGLSDGGRYTVSYASATTFDLEGTSFSVADSAAGIAFDVHSDARYFAGLAMLVWRPGRLIYIYEPSLNYTRDWKNWIQGAKPDGPYSITDWTGAAEFGSDTTKLVKAGANFTDAVLGEALLVLVYRPGTDLGGLV